MPGDPEIWEVSDDSSTSGTDTENDSPPTVDRSCSSLNAPFVTTQEDAFVKLKTNLRDHFDNISIGTTFSHQGILPNAPNPGIFLHDYGTIGFPLTEHDFERIMAASDSESGEISGDTLTPSHVYTIPGNKIATRNPAWTPVVQSIVEKVKIGLGLESKSAHAELCALVYHSPGSTAEITNSVVMPSRHNFGILDIILPSARGSEKFILEHNGKKLQLHNNGCSEWDCSFLSWFTDISVKSKSLSSDHRLILRYDLQHTIPEETSSATAIEASLSNLQSILQPWTRDRVLVPQNILGYVLSETDQSDISLHKLRGKDRLVVNQLKEVCAGSNFELYFATLQKEASGPAESFGDDYYGYDEPVDESHVMVEVEEESLHLTKLVNLDGELLRADCGFFDEINLINDDDPFDGACTDTENYDDEYMTKYYGAPMVVLIPRASRFQFMLGKLNKSDSDRNEGVLKYMADLGEITSESPAADREDMKKVCEIVLAKSESGWPSNVLSGFSHRVYLLVISSIIDLDDEVLLERTLPTCFSGPEYQPLLDKLREKKGPLWMLARAESYIAAIPALGSRCKAIESLSQYQMETDWSSNQYELALSACAPSLGVSDVAQLIQVARVLSEKQIIEIFLPTIKPCLNKQQMLCSILTHISRSLSSSERTSLPLDLVFKEILATNVGRLELLNLRDWPDDISSTEGEAGYHVRYALGKTWQQRKYRSIALVVCRAYQKEMFLELEYLFRGLCDQVQSVKWASFNDTFMPFLEALANSMRDVIPTAFNAPLFKQLFQTIVSSYVIRYHEEKPVKPVRWTRDIRGCNSDCPDCRLLDQVLLDPARQKYVFYLKAQRRQHLENQLSSDVQNGLIKTSIVKDRTPHGLVMEKTRDVFAHKLRKWSLAAKESTLRIEMLGGDVIDILSEEHYETPLPSMAKASDDNIQQAKKDIATIISKYRATIGPQKSSSRETLASSSGNTISGFGIGEKRGFSSDVSASSGSSVSDETQAKRLPAWNQWREPNK
ncbi:uncharacterized protein EAE98_011573 [Botrytis deweyae]|uniref:Uncharacterized protein n=1 Tax=Botrytis deweyae TaxID=2478750 RepID=A0ABQ7I5E1_9HELO|nr:uncharacterized protein EAE98_011573 [Botrytis deweyae]KAF7913348.1 hypothetical protein EAE98_011573 [Botrytis deweyae]